MKNKKLKLKKARRQLRSEEIHGDRLRREEDNWLGRIMDYQLKQAFPDRRERLEYIRKLYDGLGEN